MPCIAWASKEGRKEERKEGREEGKEIREKANEIPSPPHSVVTLNELKARVVNE